MRTNRIFYYCFADEMELIGFTDRHWIDKEDIINIVYMGEKYPKPWVLFVWDTDQIWEFNK